VRRAISKIRTIRIDLKWFTFGNIDTQEMKNSWYPTSWIPTGPLLLPIPLHAQPCIHIWLRPTTFYQKCVPCFFLEFVPVNNLRRLFQFGTDILADFDVMDSIKTFIDFHRLLLTLIYNNKNNDCYLWMAFEGSSNLVQIFWHILMWWIRSKNFPQTRKLAAMLRSSVGTWASSLGTRMDRFVRK
jgi:hypothetical protein